MHLSLMTHQTLQNVSSIPEMWDWAAVHARCLAVTRRILRSQAAAEDAAQEAVLRAWRMGPRAAVRNREVWLARIARNEALRIAAREADLARRSVRGDQVELAAAATESNPGDRLAATTALAALPLADREVLYLRYLEDLSQTEVARRLGIPEGTAKVRLHRARKRLQMELTRGHAGAAGAREALELGA
jgi:RNA polymerase sigma-70 factor (ECF subfamily)